MNANGLSVVLAVLVLTTDAASVGDAEEVRRVNWIPKSDLSSLGDMWTFKCPSGGTVSASVDTRVDIVDNNLSTIDPRLKIVSGKGGTVTSADNTVACTVPSACGFGCPQVSNIACGEGSLHSIIIRDSTKNASDDSRCQIGGSYVLRLEVFDKDGNSLPAKKVKLGGGASRKVPAWALDDALGPTKTGPALDDELVP